MEDEKLFRTTMIFAFKRWFKNDTNAINYALAIWDLAQMWDDLIDEYPTDKAINKAMLFASTTLPALPFMRAHADKLCALQTSTFLEWQDANVIEKNPELHEHLPKAYMLRAGIYSIFSYVAYLVGGFEWASEMGPEIRAFYGETLEQFTEEIKNA